MVQNQTVKVYGTEKMHWRGESFLVCGNFLLVSLSYIMKSLYVDFQWKIIPILFLYTAGVVAYAFSVLLGITSLPSVTAALSWKEFAFVQSKLGWICLLFAVAHDLFYGWPYMLGLSCYLPPSFQVGKLFFFIFIKIVLSSIECPYLKCFLVFFSMLCIYPDSRSC